MSDLTGQMILHYNIMQEIGQGGMGIVYKAEDCKLNRWVAIKILPPHLLVSKEDHIRFRREAKAAAALSHPNIATVYEINEYDGKPFIVMEFVEGTTLDQRIEKGPLKLKDVIEIVIQIADGLDAAHKKNIVHRDIKASNILINDENKVKILDFGLAKSTVYSKVTIKGTTLGTVAYMSPEQVRGSDDVDQRSDLWSLGVLLYEMIAGQVPFKGEYSQAVFYSIENENPEPLTAIRSKVPMSMEWVVSKLLAKNPDDRYQSARELIIDLKSIDLNDSGLSRATTKSIKAGDPSVIYSGFYSRPYVKVLVTLLLLFATFYIGWNMNSQSDKRVRKFEWREEWDIIEISPDGRKLAYTKGENFWVRQFDNLDPVKIESAEIIQYPFLWSPDSRELAFFINSNNKRQLRKASANGGQSVLISNMDDTFHPCYWGNDDSLVFVKDNSIFYKMSSTGGQIKPMYGGDSSLCRIGSGLETAYRLPGKDAMVITVNTPRQNEIIVQDRKRRKVIYSYPPDFEIAEAVYSNTGHIVFHRWATNRANHPDLWALRFDVNSFEVFGEPFLVSANAGYPDVTEDGTLFYGKLKKIVTSERLVKLTRSGTVIDSLGEKHLGIISAPSLSSDNSKIAVYGSDRNEAGIWIHQDNKKTLLIKGENAWSPVFSPDDKSIYFTDVRENSRYIYKQNLNGPGSAERTNNSSLKQYLPRISANNKYMVFTSLLESGNFDLSYQELPEKDVHPILKTGNDEQYVALSADEKFLVFQSDKNGRDEIYVSLFGDLSIQYRVSDNGGKHPLWVNNEIFYTDLHNDLMVTPVLTNGSEITFDKPKMLFSGDDAGVRLSNGFQVQKYTVTRDGQNIIAVYAPQTLQYYMVLVENWYEEFRTKEN